jgi:hypothetical protein
MTDIMDVVITLGAKVDALATDIAAVKTDVDALKVSTAPVDLTPVLAAIADVKAQLEPTPTT